MNKERIFSGIKPSGSLQVDSKNKTIGTLHLGNYIGAIKQWITLQNAYDCVYCVVDLHAITVPQDPKTLKERIKQIAALFIASGVDPKKAALLVQSHNPDHCVLAWILDCVASVGQLSRMTQYKSKSKELKGKTSVGLFNYPVLMAADILLYQTDLVPVGEDQVQHVELTRDLAQKFNSRFGKVFKLPKVKTLKVGARIMSLQNPMSKMDKSDEDPNGTVDLLDSVDEIRRKIKIAVTDSGREVLFQEDKLAIANLLTIYSHCSGLSIKEIEKKYASKGYKEFKEDLAEVVVEALRPIQKKYHRIRKDEKYLNQILAEGLRKAKSISEKTLKQVYQAVGLG